MGGASVHSAHRKPGPAIEQDCPGVLRRRKYWLDGLTDLEPERLFVIAEIWAAAARARSPDHRKTTMLVMGLRMTGMGVVLDGQRSTATGSKSDQCRSSSLNCGPSSTQSGRAFRGSRPCSEKQESEPRMARGPSLESSWTSARQWNVPTTSVRADTIQTDQEPIHPGPGNLGTITCSLQGARRSVSSQIKISEMENEGPVSTVHRMSGQYLK